MDDLDMQILGLLSRDPLCGASAVGRQVGLSPSGVRKRLDALEDDGVLAGYLAWPAAGCFDRRGIGAGFKDRIDMDAAAQHEATVWVARAPDDYSGVLGYTHDPEAWLDEIERLVGVPIDRRGPAYDGPVQALGPLEWRVLKAAVKEPLASKQELGTACGLTAKTAGRIREELRRRKALMIEPMLRPSRSGAITYHVYFDASRDAFPAVREVLGDTIVVADYGPGLYLFCRAPDMTTQAERIAAARRVPGVADLTVAITKEFHYAKDRVLGWIDEAQRRWEPARL